MALIFHSLLLLRQKPVPVVRQVSSLLSSSSFSTTTTTTTVSKSDLAHEIATTHDLTMAKSERIVNTIFDTIIETVSEGRTVRLSKFGSFTSFDAKGYTGRNPNTGEPIEIPAKKRIRFKAYDAFKNSANGTSM